MEIEKLIEAITSEVIGSIGKQNMQQINGKGGKYDASYAGYCDHTVLKAYTPQSIVKKFCDEAIKYKFASVCVNPIHAEFVSRQLKGTGVKTCCVVGFPLGANKPLVKAVEASEAIKDGAEELDMVINIGALREGNQKLVFEDIKAVTDVAKGKAKVKVIIETCYLTDKEKIIACIISKLAGADYVKTSTGFGSGGATVEDIQLMLGVVGDAMKVKASTGIETREDAEKMIRAGATRLGVSRSVHIVEGDTTVKIAGTENQVPITNESSCKTCFINN
jgi:deoxyribose-phosphate aldolase